MNRCSLCKKDFNEEPHVVERDVGSEAVIKRYPTMKICDECFAKRNSPVFPKEYIEKSIEPEGDYIELEFTTKEIGEVPEKYKYPINSTIDIQVQMESSSGDDYSHLFAEAEAEADAELEIEKELHKQEELSKLVDFLGKDLPNFDIFRRCVGCGKEFHVVANKSLDEIKIATQLCPHCKYNNQIYITIDEIEQIKQLR